MRTLTFLTGFILATTAHADVVVTFSEGAPKDRFSFVATEDCIAGPLSITIDLTGSEAGLIFDVTESGAGVEVFQPFELVAGGDLVSGASFVRDGDTSLAIALTALPKDSEVGFTIDLDDTMGGQEITVSGSEIAGATVLVSSENGTSEGVFGADAIALVPVSDCVS